MSSNISAWTLWINMVFRRTSLIHRGREFKRSWRWISAIWMTGSVRCLSGWVCKLVLSLTVIHPSSLPERDTTHQLVAWPMAGLSATAEGECCNAESLSRRSTITVVQLFSASCFCHEKVLSPRNLAPSSWNVKAESHASPLQYPKPQRRLWHPCLQAMMCAQPEHCPVEVLGRLHSDV